MGEAIKAGKVIGDGHTLFSPEFYAPYFTKEELTGLIHKHQSNDASWKTTIFDKNGEALPELEAIYNLDFLYWLAGRLGVTKSPTACGRGSQAQELVAYVSEALL